MKKLLLLLLLLTLPQESFAALTAGTNFQIMAGATASFVNGAGFNPANTNYLTNLTATSATGNAAVVSSATYNFQTSDEGAWLYIAGGSGWVNEWCQINTVSSNAATLYSGVGQCITAINAQGTVTTNASAGIATTASPSSGEGMIDYSQQDTAAAHETAGTQTAASTTFSDTTNSPFTPVMAGNLIHITACTGTGCLVGWYEIVSVTSTSAIVLDRTATNGSNNITAATYYVGGAGNFGALEDSFQSILPANAIVWMQNGSYTLSASTSTTNANCTATASCFWLGFNVTRGDTPTGANRPVISTGTTDIANGGTQYFSNMIVTGSPAGTLLTVTGINNVKATNLTSTANEGAFGGAIAVNSEMMTLNGSALKSAAVVYASGDYFHDSVSCINENSSSAVYAFGNIFEACITQGLLTGAGNALIEGNTFYGNEAQIGVGINTAALTKNYVVNNIFYGLATGINGTSLETSNLGYYNDFYNNGTNVNDWLQSPTSLALAPSFANETNDTGTTATSATTVLTDSGASFAVTNSVDVVHITSITGSGCTTGAYLITSHTSTTLTLNNSAGTACTAIHYFITQGHNFQIGTNLKAKGFPTFTNATNSDTTSYMDIGGVQRQEPAGGGVVGYAAP